MISLRERWKRLLPMQSPARLAIAVREIIVAHFIRLSQRNRGSGSLQNAPHSPVTLWLHVRLEDKRGSKVVHRVGGHVEATEVAAGEATYTWYKSRDFRLLYTTVFPENHGQSRAQRQRKCVPELPYKASITAVFISELACSSCSGGLRHG